MLQESGLYESIKELFNVFLLSPELCCGYDVVLMKASIVEGFMSDLPNLNNEEISRYSRHLLLSEVGRDGQRKLKAAKILCVGTGGLGSPVLMYLAAAGVGRLGIIDFDVVEASNLQRQILHDTKTLGLSKVESATQRLLDLNPHIQIQPHPVALTSNNALEVLSQYDIIVDGTDNFPTRYLINDACIILGKPFVYASIFKFEGQVSVFNHRGSWHRPKNWASKPKEERRRLREHNQDWLYDETALGPTYRDLFPAPPAPGTVPSCAEGGVLGILPGVIGSIQANEVIKMILGIGRTLSGRLLTYDALQMRFREFKLQRDPNAPPIRKLIDYGQFCGFPTQHVSSEMLVKHISVQEAKEKMNAGWAPFVVDVRTPQEAQIVQLPTVHLIHSHKQILQVVAQLPRDKDILLYCKRGGRSAQACDNLVQAGFTRVYNLEGGIQAWAMKIDTSLPSY